MNSIKLLLVEDEQTLASIIADTLNEQGFVVRLAFDGKKALDVLSEWVPDVVVTDIMMPAMDGFTFVEHLRRRFPTLPVIFLSARSAVEDVVKGFGLGAQDYLRKPFAMSELIVRVRALLARNGASLPDPVQEYDIGLYRFDPAHCLLEGFGAMVNLSARESEVLRMLVSNKNKVVYTRDMLLDLWGDDNYFNTRSLHVFITKLRRYLGGDPAISIVNIRGSGYKLTVDEPVR